MLFPQFRQFSWEQARSTLALPSFGHLYFSFHPLPWFAVFEVLTSELSILEFPKFTQV